MYLLCIYSKIETTKTKAKRQKKKKDGHVKIYFVAEFGRRAYHLEAIANHQHELLTCHTQDVSIKTFSLKSSLCLEMRGVDKGEGVNSYRSVGV